MEKTLYETIKSLVSIRCLKENWNGYGADPISNTLVTRCILIALNLKYQPQSITPTARNSIQFEWELEDKSYLEFEIYYNKITILCIEKMEYDKAITKTLYSSNYDSIAKDLNLLINLFIKMKFDDIAKIAKESNND